MSEFKVLSSPGRILGTGLVAYMDIGYTELVATLGEPMITADHYKVDAQWILEFPGGTAEFPEPVVATIYNYKTGRNYLGPTAPAVEDIRDWHIGGRDRRAADRVAELFPQATMTSLGRLFRAPVEPEDAARRRRTQEIIAALADADIPHDTLTGETLVALGKDLVAEHTPAA